MISPVWKNASEISDPNAIDEWVTKECFWNFEAQLRRRRDILSHVTLTWWSTGKTNSQQMIIVNK